MNQNNIEGIILNYLLEGTPVIVGVSYRDKNKYSESNIGGVTDHFVVANSFEINVGDDGRMKSFTIGFIDPGTRYTANGTHSNNYFQKTINGDWVCNNPKGSKKIFYDLASFAPSIWRK